MSTQTATRGELAEPRVAHQEEWRPVPGYDGYEASDLGRVRTWRRRANGRVLKPRVRAGYQVLRLSLGSRSAVGYPLVHRLVLLAFEGPCPDGLEVRHLDGNPSNNALSNLRYGTHSQNIMDAVAQGTHRCTRKTHCKHGHAFTEANTLVLARPNGSRWRKCLTCRRAYNRGLDPAFLDLAG